MMGTSRLLRLSQRYAWVVGLLTAASAFGIDHPCDIPRLIHEKIALLENQPMVVSHLRAPIVRGRWGSIVGSDDSGRYLSGVFTADSARSSPEFHLLDHGAHSIIRLNRRYASFNQAGEVASDGRTAILESRDTHEVLLISLPRGKVLKRWTADHILRGSFTARYSGPAHLYSIAGNRLTIFQIVQDRVIEIAHMDLPPLPPANNECRGLTEMLRRGCPDWIIEFDASRRRLYLCPIGANFAVPEFEISEQVGTSFRRPRAIAIPLSIVAASADINLPIEPASEEVPFISGFFIKEPHAYVVTQVGRSAPYRTNIFEIDLLSGATLQALDLSSFDVTAVSESPDHRRLVVGILGPSASANPFLLFDRAQSGQWVPRLLRHDLVRYEYPEVHIPGSSITRRILWQDPNHFTLLSGAGEAIQLMIP